MAVGVQVIGAIFLTLFAIRADAEIKVRLVRVVSSAHGAAMERFGIRLGGTLPDGLTERAAAPATAETFAHGEIVRAARFEADDRLYVYRLQQNEDGDEDQPIVLGIQ